MSIVYRRHIYQPEICVDNRRAVRHNPTMFTAASDIEVLDIEFQQYPEDSDFAISLYVTFLVGGQSLARLLDKQRRVLRRYLETTKKKRNENALLHAAVNSDDVLRAAKKAVQRFVREHFVYDLEMDAPRFDVTISEGSSDYSWSTKINPESETITFEIEVDAWA